MLSEEKECYLCGSPFDLEKHHCLHGSRRKKADEDGLIVYLCHTCHMRLHDTGDGDRELQRMAESYWILTHRGGIPAFIARYGKNYL